jgi:predicted metal-binding membrane protein
MNRLAVAGQWRPEWRVAALAAAPWLTLLAGVGMHHEQLPAGHSAAGLLAWLPGWLVMVTAMMVPLTLPALRHLALNSVRCRRQRAMALFTAAYVAVWVLFGIAALGLHHVLREHAGLPDGVLLALALGVAAAWQLTRAKRRALFACGRTVPLPPFGRPADAGSIRYALLHARRCLQSCWALMLVMVVAQSLAWMAALTALVLAEELTIRGRKVTRPAAAMLAAAAVITVTP